MRVHVNERRQGRYGPFCALHQVHDDNSMVEGEIDDYVSCIVGIGKLKDYALEWGEIEDIVQDPSKLKWKDTNYALQRRSPPITNKEVVTAINNLKSDMQSMSVKLAKLMERF